MEPQSYTDTASAQPAAEPARRGIFHRGWRKMTWALIGWSALVIVGGLALAGHTSNQLSSSCEQTLDGGSLCQQVGSQAGAAQFDHILKIGVVGFLILSVIWFMTRPQSRRSG